MLLDLRLTRGEVGAKIILESKIVEYKGGVRWYQDIA